MSFQFNNGLNVFCEENGWGKSTLATFIKVMFFGFENERARDEINNERKRFKPWQGGVYGGSITFETNGKTYTVTRIFETKEKDDVFELRNNDTNLESTDFSSNIGEELFKIDSSSFLRTVFISQNDCETFATGSINAKMGRLAENTDDINNFENADKRLTDILNAMSPNRKTGSIAKMKDEINSLSIDIKNSIELDKTISEYTRKRDMCQEEYEKLKQKGAELTTKKHEISKYKDIKLVQEKYGALCREYEDRKEKAEEAKSFFAGNIPDEEELNKRLEESMKISSKENTVNMYRLTAEEKSNADILEERFKDSLPCEEELKQKITQGEKLLNIKIKLAREKLNDEEKERLVMYENQFLAGYPEDREIQAKVNDWNRRSEKKQTISVRKANIDTMKSSVDISYEKGIGNMGFLPYAVIVCGIIAALAGVIITFNQNMIFGVVMVLAGGLLCVTGILNCNQNRKKLLLKRKIEEDNISSLEAEVNEDIAFIDRIEKNIIKFFKAYDIKYDELNVINELYELKSNIADYKRLMAKKKTMLNMNAEAECKETETEVRQFIKKYYGSVEAEAVTLEQFGNYIRRLEGNVKELKALRNKRENYINAKNEYENSLAMLRTYIASLSITPDKNIGRQLLGIKENLQRYKLCVKEMELLENRKKEYERNHNDIENIMNIKAEGSEASLEELDRELEIVSDRIEELHKSILDYNNLLDEKREKRDIISEKEEELKLLNKVFEENKKKYKHIKSAKELLISAKNSFTAKYMEPVMSGFRKYYGILTHKTAEAFYIDANTNITVEEMGMQRKPEALSTGYRDLIGICMRMSLVDAMYDEEKPFIIFDDPFVNLDDDKINGGLNFLSCVSEEYQVIYFTCHESRR